MSDQPGLVSCCSANYFAQQNSRGFTLLELLVSLTIISILLLSALPGMSHLLNKNEADSSISTVFRAWQHARSLAATRSQRVLLCGSDDGLHCKKQWKDQLILFVDNNNNYQPDNDETLQRYEFNHSRGNLQTRVGFGKNYVIIDPLGKAPLTGSFLLCNPDEPSLERKISWNMAGRLYLTGNHSHHKGNSTIHCPS
ncbi:GspH/FimT family pseudopilin [Aestuariicella sp. G3-2]|uniref:GspH/FimT family pseudopilin n=1 Tax=Pseudomaricurvus albidus TaxID=2842452 RepID=UPI001C0DFC73|nr:GspH/FimT family pseudopilin [Aestuariicella albida]MBU3070686.1 GspH/FimT family pseudopilin [Aestuariicella albida]